MIATKAVDDVLGRDYELRRRDRTGTVLSAVTVVAHDPEKGFKLFSRMHGDAWVPTEMFDQLLEEGVLW